MPKAKPRIVLISPARPFLFDKSKDEPLGIFFLEAILKREGHDVTCYDLGFDKKENLPPADIYGFSASSIDYPRAVQLGQELKRRFPEAKTVIGGIHVTAMGKPDPHFDTVVIGEGELAFLELLQDWQDGELRPLYRVELIKDIDSLPIPPRTLRHRIKYHSVRDDALGATVFSSRGCAFNCSFCASSTIWDSRVRFHSPERVAEELTYLRDTFGIRTFEFVDDMMTVNKKRLESLCAAIAPLGVEWFCATRADRLLGDQLKIMKEAGCVQIAFGIESGSQKVLQQVDKRLDLEIAKQAVISTREAGIDVKLYLITGLPGEDDDTADLTIKFIEETKPLSATIFTFVPLPGSNIYCNPAKYGIESLDPDWEKYQHSIGGNEAELQQDFPCRYKNRTQAQLKATRRKLKYYLADYYAKNLSR